MESNKTNQKKFAGIVSDVNQINIDIEKGAMADNFNGRVAQIGENLFSWTSMSGVTKTFSIPNKNGSIGTALAAKANVYMFDDRMFAKKLNTNISQVIGNSQTGTYEYVLQFQAYKSDFSNVENTSPPFELLIKQIVVKDSSGNVSAYDLKISWSILGVTAWADETTFNLISYSDKLAKMHDVLAYYYNLKIDNVNTSNGLYGSRGVYATNGISKYCQITIASNKTSNIVIKNKKGMTAETPLYFSKNRIGFGLGSIYENLGYPNAPEYPIPGSDYNLNPFSDDYPYGLCRNTRNGKNYVVYSGGIVYTTIPYGNYNGGKGTVFKMSVDDEADPISTPMFEFIRTNDEEPLIIEMEPIGFGYGLTIQRYKAAQNFKTMAYRQNGAIGIDKFKCIMFLSIGNESTLIVLINTENKKVEVTPLLETEEFIDIDEDCKINGFAKYDNENNLRIYWTSGKGHIRLLNLNDIPTNDIEINTRLFKPCNFGEINVNRVSKSGGSLLCGAYQFCFELSIDGFIWTRASQHTNPVMIGQSYFGVEGLVGTDIKTATYPKPNDEIDGSYRGAEPGTKTTESINVLITNIDKRYNYIRVFSIEYISGSSSKIVNCIYQNKLSETEKYSFSCTHSGANNVVEGNFELSEVTIRKRIPLNVKHIAQINNRMIISNFTEEYKLRADLPLNSNISFVKTTQGIGVDTEPSIPNKLKNNGYKNWVNQYLYKTLPAYSKSMYAWIYIDEYGNESEPSQPFELELDFRKLKNIKYNNNWSHPNGVINWNKFYLSAESWDLAIAKSNQQSLYSDEIEYETRKITGGYELYAYGLNIKVNNPTWPNWAKKAILVEKKQQLNNSYSPTEGFGILTQTGIKMAYLPDADGYNVYNNYNFKQGDKIRILNVSAYTIKGNALYNDPTTYFFCHNNNYINSNRFYFDIVSFKQQIYPKPSESGFKVGEDKMPDETINMRAFDISFNINNDIYNELLAAGGIPSDNLKGIVKFQIERENSSTNEDIEEYTKTNFEIDLTKRYNGNYKRAFIGNNYISTNHQIVTMRNNYFRTEYLNVTAGYYNFTKGFNPVIVNPLITKFNMAMADDSVFPFLRINPVINNFTAYGFKKINRDYAAENNLNNYKYISQEFLKPRSKFDNIIMYSNPTVIGRIYDSYVDINPINSLEVQSDFGQIIAVFYFNNHLLVQQQFGFRKYVIDSKEFVQTTNGTMITITSGNFISSVPLDLSTTFGSYYPGIKGEKGIYFVSSQHQIFCLATEKEIILLSVLTGFQNELSKFEIVEDTRNVWTFNDVILFKDKEENMIYLYIVSRKSYKILSISQPMIISKTLSQPKIGEKYSYLRNNTGTTVLQTILVTDISVNAVGYLIEFDVISEVPYKLDKLQILTLYLTDTKSPELYSFNENYDFLEYRSSNLRINQHLEKIFVDTQFGNQINIESSESEFHYDNVNTDLKVPMDSCLWNNLFYPNKNVVISENTTLNNLATNFVLSIPNGIPANQNYYLLSSNKEFHFLKGVKYTIQFNISFPSGGGMSSPQKLFFGPVYDVLKLNANPIGINDFLDAAYPASSVNEYSFIPHTSFIAPLSLLFVNNTNTYNGLIFCLKLLKFDYTEQFESYPVMYVTNGKSEMISYDNLILTVKEENVPNRIEIYSKEQEENLIISNPNTYGKLRLRQFQMAIPKLNTKERLRSTYFTIKFVYTFNKIKNVINSLESYIRTL